MLLITIGQFNGALFQRNKVPGDDLLPKRFEAMPIALSLRPLGGLYNPFSSACSVLCNHPAPAEIKEVISKCKQTLAVDGKRIQHLRALLQDKFEYPSSSYKGG